MLDLLKPMVTDGQMAELRSIVAEVKQRIARLDRAKKSGKDPQ